MKNEKTTENDGIAAEVIKYAGRNTRKILAEIYREILRSKHIPHKWNTANIILIHKKGNKQDLTNYRPLTLVPIVYKIFKTIGNNRL